MKSRIRAGRVSLILMFVVTLSGPAALMSQVAAATNGNLPDPTYDYTKSNVATVAGKDVTAEGVATDAAGNIYQVGSLTHSATFNNTDSFPTRNGYITKYSPSGAYLSTIGVGDTTNGWAAAEGVAVDAAGSIYVTGAWAGSVVFGGRDALTDSSTSQLPYVMKFNADGSYVWTRTFYAPNGQGNATGVAVDQYGGVYFTGFFYGTIAFGMGETGTGDGNGTSTFLTKYDSNGNYAYTKTLLASNGSGALSTNVATNSLGDVTIVGNYGGTMTFGASDTHTSPSGSGFVSTFSRNGTYLSTKTVDTTTGYVAVSGVSSAPDNSQYVVGGFTGTVTFGGTDTFTDAGNMFDSFITKYDAHGTYLWTRSFDTTHGYIQAANISVDADGTAYIVGGFSGTVGYPGLSDTFSDLGGRVDGFVSSFSGNGTYQWTRSFETAGGGVAQVYGLAVTPNRQLYVVGSYGGPVTFGGADTFNTNAPTTATPFITRYTIPALQIPVVVTPPATDISAAPTITAAKSPVAASSNVTPPLQPAYSAATTTSETNDETAVPTVATVSPSSESIASAAPKKATTNTNVSSKQNIFTMPITYIGTVVVIVVIGLLVRSMILRSRQ